ncbi:MAG: DNA cytosine methyltransferase [Rhodobacteraceae bacterium]|nr:DNA cytosine methyltransferase [Paracoccaceae bacterium]
MGIMLAQTDFHTRCYVEWEEYPRSTIIAGMDAGYFAPAPIWTDVTSFDGKPYKNAIDTILAGYPCQPFSQAGKRKGANDERHLWPDIARIIREVQPPWVILENVAGHVTLGAETVQRELQDMGFEVAAGLFTAAETRAPHKRERWLCVAYSKSNARRLYARSRSGGQREADLGRAGRELDNTERDRRPTGRTGNNRRHVGEQPNAAGCAMANAQGFVRRGKQQQSCEGRGRAGFTGSGAELAYSHFERPQRRERGGEARTPGPPDRQPSECCGTMADTIGHAGYQRRHSEGFGANGQRKADSFSSYRPRLHPPGPTRSVDWENVLRTAPHLAPALSRSGIVQASQEIAARLYATHAPIYAQSTGAGIPGQTAAGALAEAAQRILENSAAESAICRMVDGLAKRSRALKLLGNGVHPLEAGYAIRTLLDAHGCRRMDVEAACSGGED